MTAADFWRIMTGAQVSTALVLISVALVYIAFKLSNNKGTSRISRGAIDKR